MASNFSIRHAARIVKNGGVIAYPTDTIYGLGCTPYDPDAIEQINVIKQRPLNKQFILLAASLDQVRSLLSLDEAQAKKITLITEPTSWVIDASEKAPSWLTSAERTLTIRISKNNDVQRLCNALGHAIISTSANISGATPAKNALELHRFFHQKVDKILIANKPPTGKPSRIIRLRDNHIFRQ